MPSVEAMPTIRLYNEFVDSTTTLTDPLWHASVSTLGWRVDSRLAPSAPGTRRNRPPTESEWPPSHKL